MTRALRRFAAFWLDFVVGDDWRVAAGVVSLVAGGAVLVQLAVVRTGVVAIGIAAAVVLLTTASIALDARRAGR